MDSAKCDCLYRALLTTREDYNKDQARQKYRELIQKNIAVPNNNVTKNKIVRLLDIAKLTLGNLVSERRYHLEGDLDYPHSCADAQSTIEAIKNLETGIVTPLAEQQQPQTPFFAELLQEEINNALENKLRNSPQTSLLNDGITIQRVIGHRFRGDQIKLSIIISPGDIRIIEDEERVTANAPEKTAEYLRHMRNEKPKSLQYLLRKKPSLLQLFRDDYDNE